MADSRFQA